MDVSTLDPAKKIVDKEGIYARLPHRHEFSLLDGILFYDAESHTIAGVNHLREDDFWVRGHIPGRPLFPGVLMIETAAQLVSYAAMSGMEKDGFLGFAAVDDVKFRGEGTPGADLIMLGRMLDIRPRRVIGETQGFIDGKMIYEGKITGMWL
jgi:3-hydroxyacyl-[acyl-carrier-protein] dehydratase